MKQKLRTDFQIRQYMLSKDFEIYYYSDRNMKNVRDHTHNYYEFYFFLEGNVAIHIGEQTHLLEKGDMILIPPGLRHHVDILERELPYRRFVFWISRDYCDHLIRLAPAYGYIMQHVATTGQYIFHFDKFTFNNLQSKISNLIEELHTNRFGRETRLDLDVKDLIFSINRSIYDSGHPKTPKEEQSLYQNVLQYLEDHLEEELTLNGLAEEFYVSKYHIAHIFKENLGLSVHQYIIKKRLVLCREMILSGTEITKACLLCGFSDYSVFFRAFKKEYGISPKEFKELSYCNPLP